MKHQKFSILANFALVLLILTTLLAFGCGDGDVTPADETPADETPAVEVKTLKIGVLVPFESPTGLDALHLVEVMAESDNQAGGLDIGGEIYEIEVVAYDNGSDQTTSVAAVNKLVFEDDVQFILFDPTSVPSAWLSTTEENKVIALGPSPDASNLLPDVNYSFCSTCNNSTNPITAGWFAENYPDEAEQGVLVAYPDDMMGHMFAEMTLPVWEVFDVNVTTVFFPADATDLSAVATQVKAANPGAFSSGATDEATSAILYKAVRQAGYEGMFFGGGAQSTSTYLEIAGASVIEGFICAAYPTDFDPALTDLAQEFKDSWIAEYGEWEYPSLILANLYPSLKAALLEAGSIDTDAVADVLASGLEFESITGTIKMISRMDLGNSRTVDSISEVYMQQIQDGESVLLDIVVLEDAAAYFELAYPPAD